VLTVKDKKADALAAIVLVIIVAIDVSGDRDLPQDLRTKRNASMTAVGDELPDTQTWPPSGFRQIAAARQFEFLPGFEGSAGSCRGLNRRRYSAPFRSCETQAETEDLQVYGRGQPTGPSGHHVLVTLRGETPRDSPSIGTPAGPSAIFEFFC